MSELAGKLKESPPEPALVDGHGRRVRYLRLSITDLCNLRCFYCMPACGVRKLPHDQVLRYEELLEVTRVAVGLGVTKVRVTGGEPLVKRGVVKLVREIAALAGVRELAMTTNGTRLAKFAEALAEAGLMRVNVSLDSFDPEVFRRMTRVGDVADVLRGVDAALAVGFPVKINTVLVRGLNAGEVERFVAFGAEKGVEVRFIERMGFEDAGPFVGEAEVLEALGRRHALAPVSDPGDGHVRRYDCDGVRVGFISPRSRPFCRGCDKIRLTLAGELRACLASDARVDVRAVLRAPHTDADVARAISETLAGKPAAGPWTARAEMWRIGG